MIDGHCCIEHGWVEHDRVVIDPTLPDDDIAYFPGLRFTGDLGIARALRVLQPDGCEDRPILYRFGWGGIESPEFRGAIASVFAEFLRRHPPVDKRQVIGELCRLSAGSRVTEFKGSRAKELTELWRQGPQGLPD